MGEETDFVRLSNLPKSIETVQSGAVVLKWGLCDLKGHAPSLYPKVQPIYSLGFYRHYSIECSKPGGKKANGYFIF